MGSQLQENIMVIEPTHLKTEIKYMNPHILKIKTKRVGVFCILEDKTRS